MSAGLCGLCGQRPSDDIARFVSIPTSLEFLVPWGHPGLVRAHHSCVAIIRAVAAYDAEVTATGGTAEEEVVADRYGEIWFEMWSDRPGIDRAVEDPLRAMATQLYLAELRRRIAARPKTPPVLFAFPPGRFS